MAIQLKVSPQVLKSKASAVTSDIQKLQRNWNKIGQTIRASKGYWEGDGSNKHQKYYKEVTDDVTTILKRLKEHPKDLMKMAGVYDAAEQKSMNQAGKLPDDVIR